MLEFTATPSTIPTAVGVMVVAPIRGRPSRSCPATKKPRAVIFAGGACEWSFKEVGSEEPSYLPILVI